MVWAFDSFQGLPESTAVDGPESKEWVGEAIGSERKLIQGFEKYADLTRLRIAKGWFEETLPRYRGEIGPIAFLHIDADWYESVRVALEELYPLVVPEGYVAIDDYKVWPGAKAATDEFRERNQVSARFVGGHYWKKPRNRVAGAAWA